VRVNIFVWMIPRKFLNRGVRGNLGAPALLSDESYEIAATVNCCQLRKSRENRTKGADASTRSSRLKQRDKDGDAGGTRTARGALVESKKRNGVAPAWPTRPGSRPRTKLSDGSRLKPLRAVSRSNCVQKWTDDSLFAA
jgi:hypothetical protein